MKKKIELKFSEINSIDINTDKNELIISTLLIFKFLKNYIFTIKEDDKKIYIIQHFKIKIFFYRNKRKTKRILRV